MDFPKNPHLWQGRDGTSISSYGNIYVLDREVFVDDVPLAEYLVQFSGKVGGFEFVFPEDTHDYDVDEKIRPLVVALQEKGLRTLGSCEGHLPEGRFGKYSPKPYVSFLGELDVVPAGWVVEETTYGTKRLTVGTGPTTEEELVRAHELILLAVRKL